MINCHNNQHICLLPEFIYFNGFKTVFTFVYSKKAGKYVTLHIFTRFLQDLISYLPEIESFLPCLFTIEGLPLYSISPLPLAFASNCLEA